MRASPTQGQVGSGMNPGTILLLGPVPRPVVWFCALFELYVLATEAWSGRMKMLPRPPNCCVTGAMKLSPIRMFLSSSFTNSKPGGSTTSTTYLPGGRIGSPALSGSASSPVDGTGSATQIVQFVLVGLPVGGSNAVTLGN